MAFGLMRDDNSIRAVIHFDGQGFPTRHAAAPSLPDRTPGGSDT